MRKVHSTTITKGNRVYSFDVTKNGNDEFYLAITESRKGSPVLEQYQVIIFDEDANDFVDCVNNALEKLQELRDYKPAGSKAYSVEGIRQTHKQAYAPWTVQDDNRLGDLLSEGKSIPELALLFERNKGAINSRIKKLELQAKRKQ